METITIEPFSLLFLFGALLAFLMLIALNIERAIPTTQRRLVSSLLICLGVVLIYYVVAINKYYSIYPYIDSFGTAGWMAIMPVFYLLTMSLMNEGWRLKWKHLLVVFVPLIFMVEGVLTTAGLPVWFYSLISDGNVYLDIWMFLFFSTGLFFGLRSSMHLQKYKDQNLHKELKWFSGVFQFILICYGVVFLFIRGNYVQIFELSLIALFEIFILVLVFKFFQANGIENLFSPIRIAYNQSRNNPFSRWSIELEDIMQTQKPFLDKKLNLNKLSALTSRSPNDLSRLFSQHYNSNFYDFINKYRLEHLEEIIQQPDADKYKIIALAEESGFNSKATFYKVFKAKHAMTPAQFLKKKKED